MKLYLEQDFLDEHGQWHCIQCGHCCRNVRFLLPRLADENGHCIHLLADNRCAVYGRPERPLMCRNDSDAAYCAKVANNGGNLVDDVPRGSAL